MTAIILDNNESDAHILRDLLKDVEQEIHVSNQFYNLPSFIDFWLGNPLKVDIIFMEIIFDGVNIFDQIDVTKICKNIIITTNQKDFAVKAFRKNVTDFLLKPIQKNHLLESIEKAKKMIFWVDEHKKSLYKSYLQVSMGKKIINFKIDEIDYVESSNKMTYIHLISGKRVPTIIPLFELEKILDPLNFFRANRQVILHFDTIHSIEKYKSSKYNVRIKSNLDKVILLSEEKSKAFRSWIDR